MIHVSYRVAHLNVTQSSKIKYMSCCDVTYAIIVPMACVSRKEMEERAHLMWPMSPIWYFTTTGSSFDIDTST